MNQLDKDLGLPARAMGYLSAPMSAPDALQRTRNHLVALDASARLWEMEALHYCPHRNSPQVGTSDVPYERWIAMDLEVLRRCNYIVMVGQWNASLGCRRELAVAMHLGLRVAYSVESAIALDHMLKETMALPATLEPVV
jgi:hypothetical protein